jgi:hypothetical protein
MRNKARMAFLTIPINSILEVLTNAIRKEKVQLTWNEEIVIFVHR